MVCVRVCVLDATQGWVPTRLARHEAQGVVGDVFGINLL